MKKVIGLNPTENRMVVQADKAEDKTASGIIIPDTAKEKLLTGTIIWIGPGTENNPVTMKQGDRVMFSQYAGTEIKINGLDYLMMRENDVFGTLVEQDIVD